MPVLPSIREVSCALLSEVELQGHDQNEPPLVAVGTCWYLRGIQELRRLGNKSQSPYSRDSPRHVNTTGAVKTSR